MNTASNLTKPAPTLRLRYRLGRVYKNCLGAATVIGFPRPYRLIEKGARYQDFRGGLRDNFENCQSISSKVSMFQSLIRILVDFNY